VIGGAGDTHSVVPPGLAFQNLKRPSAEALG